MVEIEFLSDHAAVEVDDADVPVDVRGESTDGWVANGMVATEDHWENALRRDVADAFADLIERFLQIAWDRADVANIDHVELLPQVDTHLIVVSTEKVGGAADTLRTESGPWPIGRAGV